MNEEAENVDPVPGTRRDVRGTASLITSVSHRLAGRMAAVLFTLSGVVALLEALQPAATHTAKINDLIIGLGAVVVGGVVWCLPWGSWSKAATLAMLPVALLLIVAGGLWGSFDPFTFGSYYMVVFVWIGITQRRWISLVFVCPAAASYLEVSRARGAGSLELVSVFGVMGLCLLVAESLAWFSVESRRAEAVDTDHLTAIDSLLRAGAMMAGEHEGARVPRLVSDLSTQLLRARAAMVILPEGGDAFAVAGSARWPGAEPGTRIARSDLPHDLGSAKRGEVVTLPCRRIAIGETFSKGAVIVFFPLPASANITLGYLAAVLGRERAVMDAFTVSLGVSFATQAGLTLERLHATQALLHQALGDELTGIGNRRFANSLLSQLSDGDAIVMVDLDGLKELNDTKGHAAGDRALKEVAAHMEQSLREDDVAARVGGDEFLMILRGAGPAAVEIARRLRDCWDAEHDVGFSLGVAVHETGRTSDETLARADAALYEDKQLRARALGNRFGAA